MSKKIGFAVQRGNQVVVYDEHNSFMFSQTGVLAGYSSSTVAVLKSDGRTHIYDNRNSHKYSS